MKKKWNRLLLCNRPCLAKLLLKMKLLSLLLFVSVVSMASTSYSQQTKFTINYEKVTIGQVFHRIEESSEFIFLYSEKSVNLKRKVNISVEDEDINFILNQLFEGTDNYYEINDRQISILLKSNRDVTKETLEPIENGLAKPQKKTISGKVTDIKGDPLPGVTVIIKGTTQGTTTDFDGKFSISDIASDAILNFSFVGMKMQEIPTEGKTSINVQMEEDAIGIEEVVAVGYGSMKKIDITGSVSSIKSENIEKGNPVDILVGIQGKLSGVKITSSSGDPSAGVDITIRGKNSIYAGTTPLFVIDGMPYDYNSNEIVSSSIGNNNGSNPLSLINPADIESVSVLKDASATSIYGSRGANGVIIINTKNATKDQVIYSLGASIGIANASREIPVLSGNEFIEYRRQVDPTGDIFYSRGDLNYPQNPYSYPQHDWQDEILRTAVYRNYNFSILGKTKGNNYSLSLGALNNDAVVRNNDQQRYTMNLKLDNKKSERFEFGLGGRGTYSTINGASQSGGGSNLFNGIVQNLIISTPVEFYNPDLDPGDEYISPLSMIDDAYKKSETISLNTNAYINFKISDLFKLVFNGGNSLSSSKGSEFYGKDTNWGVGDNGYARLAEARVVAINGSAQLHYSNTFRDVHKVNAMIATESNVYNYESFGLTQTNFLTESTGINDVSKGSTTKNVDSYRDKNRRVSFFGRVNYNYRDKHLFTLNLRADGSDKFASGKRFGYFPSAAYSWVLSNEGFMDAQTLFSNLKLRFSYGVSGNDRIPSYRYLARLSTAYYDGELGMAPSSQANDKLKWETTYQGNIGADVGLLKNRIELTADFYKKQTHDMLMSVPTAGQTGYSEQWQNIGQIDNKGFELQITSRNISGSKFSWTTEFNISHNENEIVDLGGSDYLSVNVGGGWITDIGRVALGQPIGRAYGYQFDGIYQIEDFTWQDNSNPDIVHKDRDYVLKEDVVSVAEVNVQPGAHKFKDLDDDGEITLDDDRTFISSTDPKIFGGITNTFNYKNFDLSIFIEGSYGNEVFNEAKYRLEGGALLSYMNITKDFYYNHWTSENPTNKYGTYGDGNATSMLTSSYYVEDASFLRLKTVNLGYTFKGKLLSQLNLKSARVYATGTNLLTLTKYSGYDPEVSGGSALMKGVDHISYPRARTFIFGINVSF